MDCIAIGSVLNLFSLFSFNEIPLSTQKKKGLVLFCLNYIWWYTWIFVTLQNIAGPKGPVWFEKKWGLFCILFYFSMRPIT